MTLPTDIDRLINSPILTIEPWADAVVESVGYGLRDFYVEAYLGPVIGPTCLVLLRRLGLGFALDPEGFTLDVAETAAGLGVGATLGRNSAWWRSVGRLMDFGVATVRGPGTLAVRRSVAPLPQRLVRRLPAPLQRSHALALTARERTSVPARPAS
jgi:hypothetical protein